MTLRWHHAAAIAVLAAVAACGGGGDGGAAETGGSSSGNGGGQDASQAQAQRPLKEPAAGDLADFDCDRKKGAWAAEGEITSSAKSTMRYTLTVVTVRGEDEVVGEKIERFTVEPDETVSFEFPMFYRGQADSCMPRLERAPA